MTAPPLRQPQPSAIECAGDGSNASRPELIDPLLVARTRRQLASLAAHLLVAVIALVGIGGATRVMEAGLACPDWPLCYGSLLPGRQMNLQVFLEWFHRLDAFVVGIGLLVLAAASLGWRRRLPAWQPPLALSALLLVAVQGGLGALTVLRLLPAAIVTAHLITALLLVLLLSACHQGLIGASAASVPSTQVSIGPPGWSGWSVVLRVALSLALLALFAQCLLGGLMASQWAAGRCLSAGEACGWLLAHRLTARLVAALVLLPAALLAWRRGADRPLALLAALLVLAQIALGVLSLRLTLAVPIVTVAHQITAALLVAVLSALAVRHARGTPVPLELSHG